jgi:hypothetical protein
MNKGVYQSKSNTILRIVIFLNIILVLSVYFLYRTNSWPVGIEASGCLVSFILLAILSILHWTTRNRLIDPDQKRYVALGLCIGLLWTIEISINNFIRPGLPLRDIIDDIFWAIVALLILITSIRETYRVKKFSIGLKSGFWTGFASGAIACFTALLFVVFGMKYLLLDSLNVKEWTDLKATADTSDIAVYFAYETFTGAIMHLVVLGVFMGLILGSLGGVIGWTLKALRK